MKNYAETFDREKQVDLEEQIASLLFDRIPMFEEEAADIGRDVLYLVVVALRPDLIRNHKRNR